MWWRLSRSEFSRQRGAKNKAALRKIVKSGEPRGILAYAGGEPVGWCAVAPRETYPSLERSRVLARIDDKPVWSITCFFVAKPFRRRGVMTALLEHAIGHVRKRGGKAVEGYPVDPKAGGVPDVFVYTGLASAFRKAGFKECLRRSETRPIMRYKVTARS
jgi:GNAT superfamily N-acetyltransferase